jgi:hypothetical protein
MNASFRRYGVGETCRSHTGRQGRQPDSSCRSDGTGPLPLVADFVKKFTILDVGNTEHVLCARAARELRVA